MRDFSFSRIIYFINKLLRARLKTVSRRRNGLRRRIGQRVSPIYIGRLSALDYLKWSFSVINGRSLKTGSEPR